ncbi:MAG: hypothetical protein J6J35_01435 [Alphaproteobacteria bacterium]|nr:hypothetical protein [Alphaproteobacteria bacterium]
MSDNAGNSTSWWQWIANTAQEVYQTKLGADVAMKNSEVLAQQQEDNNTLSFLGMTLHKDTLLWVGGGTLLVVLVVALLRK